MKIKFKDIRPIISRIDKISICIKETMQYYNYNSIELVPEEYDNCFVHGIGIIESEFEIKDADSKRNISEEKIINEKNYIDNCIEIMLTQKG